MFACQALLPAQPSGWPLAWVAFVVVLCFSMLCFTVTQKLQGATFSEHRLSEKEAVQKDEEAAQLVMGKDFDPCLL